MTTIYHPTPGKVSTDDLVKRYLEAGDIVETALNDSAEKLKESIEAGDRAASPFTSTAVDALNELRIMTGLGPTSDKAGRLKELLKDFDDVEGLIEAAGGKLTGEQIAERRRGMADYQASAIAGQQAMERSQAAQGISDGGRAMAAAQEYGLRTLDMSYQAHLDRMTNIAGLTAPIALQQQARSVSEATALYNARTAGARAKADILTKLGDAEYAAQKFNIDTQLEADLSRQKAQTDIFATVIAAQQADPAKGGNILASQSNRAVQQFGNPALAQGLGYFPWAGAQTAGAASTQQPSWFTSADFYAQPFQNTPNPFDAPDGGRSYLQGLV